MTQLLNELAKLIEVAQKHTTPTGNHINPTVLGPNSLFGGVCLERDIINSRVIGDGLAGMLPAFGSISDYPMYGYITGKNAATGTQPANACGDPPNAGAFRSGFQTAQFGRYMFDTRELDIGKAGRLVNSCDVTNLRFVGDPVANEIGAILPPVFNDPNTLFQYGAEVLERMVEVGEEFREAINLDTYVGTGTGTKFAGLEKLVATNIIDAQTGLTLTNLASDVRDFADVNVTSVAGSASIVSTLISMMRFAKQKARQMRLQPVTWVLVMRSQMLQSLANVWPCQSQTFGCLPANANVSINVEADGNSSLSHQMINGSYLWIDSIQVPVIQDDWMPETDLGGNVFSSDIYLLPMTIKNGQPVLFHHRFHHLPSAYSVL